MPDLQEYVSIYRQEHGHTEDEEEQLREFFKKCLEKGKLTKVKDVSYDKTNAIIKCIPALTFSRSSKHFTLKNMDKNFVGTMKNHVLFS